MHRENTKTMANYGSNKGYTLHKNAQVSNNFNHLLRA